MLKIFRSLRKQLLLEGKLKNYVLYALGEIFLVVVGILIALAINNAQQRSETRKRESVYLSGLQKEFEISKNKLETLIRVNKTNYEEALRILSLMNAPESFTDEKRISQLVFGALSNDISFNPNNALLHEMINSGSLRDLSDPELRKELTNWISTLDDIAKQEAGLMLQRDHVLDLMRNDRFRLSTVLQHAEVAAEFPASTITGNDNGKGNNMALYRSPAFENNLLLFILSGQSTEQAHYLPLLQDLNRILDRISRNLGEDRS